MEFRRSGTSDTNIEDQMKADVTSVVEGIAADGEGGGYVFSSTNYVVRDPERRKKDMFYKLFAVTLSVNILIGTMTFKSPVSFVSSLKVSIFCGR